MNRRPVIAAAIVDALMADIPGGRPHHVRRADWIEIVLSKMTSDVIRFPGDQWAGTRDANAIRWAPRLTIDPETCGVCNEINSLVADVDFATEGEQSAFEEEASVLSTTRWARLTPDERSVTLLFSYWSNTPGSNILETQT